MAQIEFWFDFASTYSYLSTARIEALAKSKSAKVIYRPFLLGPIFNAQGWSTSPFVLYPAKGEYMWMDVARQAAKYGLDFKKPSVFPRNGLLAARIATAAEHEAWLPQFVSSVFKWEFTRDTDIANSEVLLDLLQSLGVDGSHWIAKASEDTTKNLLRQRTDEAKAMGIFGAPTFFAQGVMYWGDDRLTDAIAQIV